MSTVTEKALLQFLARQSCSLPNDRTSEDGAKSYRFLSRVMCSAVEEFDKAGAIHLSTCCALHFFVYHRMHDCFRIFKWGNCFNSFDFAGLTPLMTAAKRARLYPEECLVCMQALVRYGADINVTSEKGQSAIGAYYEAMSKQSFNKEFGYPLELADSRIVVLLTPDGGLSDVDQKHRAAYNRLLSKRKRELHNFTFEELGFTDD